MEVVCTVAGKIIEQITERLFTSIGRQISYVVHYKENIKNLKDEVDNLGDVKGRVQGMVQTARDNGEVVEDHVSRWLSKAHGMEEDVKKLLEDADHTCFRGWCPAVRSRYRLGKEGKKKIMVVIGLKDDGKFDIVAHRAPAPDTWFKSITDYKHFESRALVFKEIMVALRDDESYIIGIYGAGGVGKTRMAEEIGKHAKKDKFFDEVAMACVSQNPDVRKIQGELADCLNLKLDLETELGRAGQLWNRLKNGKKILVIIDDVWKQINLKEIGIPFVDNIKGCKIVLTSRSQGVCLQMGVQKRFSIGVLSTHESWILFKKKVGNSIDSPEMQSIAEGVCRECAGLPLAILAVGGVLMKYKNKHVWDDALEQLRNSRLNNVEGMEATVYSSLELSYNYLEPADVKSYFLLCCLFPEDAEISIDDLVRYGVGMRLLRDMDTMEKARNRVYMLVDTIKTSCLLLEGRNDNLVKMHDVIRDVAISIAKKEEHGFLVKTGVEEWPEKDEFKCCRVLSLRSKNIHELPDELECPELHTLVLECSNPSLQVPNSLFNGMEKLKVLHLSNMRILSLPSSLPKLVNLRMLCLNNCRLVDMALLKELTKLEILSLNDSNIKELAPEVRQLTHLRVLDLRNCDNLRILPFHVISCLSRLEELCISDEFDEWEVEASNQRRSNASLVELNSLIRLINLEIHIPNVMLLPKDLSLESLARFKISMGSNFGRCRNFSSTRVLKLEHIPLKDEVNVLMKRTEELYLNKLRGLKKVLHDRDGEGFSELKYLYVDNCDDMDYLLGKPNFFSLTQGSFCKLRVLQVQNCKLKYLFSPSTARGLLQLQELKIGKCESMEEVVLGDVEEVMEKIIFHQLKTMSLWFLPNLRSFYGNLRMMSTSEGSASNLRQTLFNGKVVFPVLAKLWIRSLENIREIWDNQSMPGLEEGSFCQLKDLWVWNCDQLLNVVSSNMLLRLQNLESLYVRRCKSMISEVEGIDVEEGSAAAITILPRLEKLDLRALPKLRHIGLNKEEFSHSFLVYPNLTTLRIEECTSLRNVLLPSTARNLVHLQELNIYRCEEMEEIVAVATGKGEEEANDEIIVFPELKTLSLIYLVHLRSFYCSTTCGSKGEKEETVQDIPQRHSLFNHKVAFPVLEELRIDSLKNIREIWDNQSLSAPEEESICEVEKCGKLESVVSFNMLTTLRIYNCTSLRNVFVPSIARNLVHLQDLTISWCTKMEEVVAAAIGNGGEEANNEIIVFPQLQNLHLESLTCLKSFSCGSKEETMQQLNPDIPQRHFLFNHKVEFPCLKVLRINSLDKVKEIWCSTVPNNSVCKLRKLTVQRCGKLLSVAPSKLLGNFENLQELNVEKCGSLEEVFKVKGPNIGEGIIARDEAMRTEAKNNILSCQLKSVTLKELPQLTSFYLGSCISELPFLVKMRMVSCPKLEIYPCPYLNTLKLKTINAPSQSFSNEKVAFHILEELEFSDGCIFEYIGHGHIPAGSLSKVRVLTMKNCNELVNVTTLLQRFEVVDELAMISCSSLEVVFDLEGLNGTERQAALSSQINKLELNNLPKLTHIWMLDPHGVLVFHNLRALKVIYCHSVRYLFSVSIARGLTQLEDLQIFSCYGIKEIVTNEEQGEEDAVKEIVFPKLIYLMLGNLPNLASFCQGNYAFDFPYLKKVWLHLCPKMQNFTSGCTSTPRVIMLGDGPRLRTTDLTSYVQQHIWKEKGSAVDNNVEE